MKLKILLGALFVLIAVGAAFQYVSADMVNPDWFNNRPTCSTGEKTVHCSSLGGKDTSYNACEKYKQSADYRFLVSSWKGKDIYCQLAGKPGLSMYQVIDWEFVIAYGLEVITALIITIALELLVGVLYARRKNILRRLLRIMFFMNLISAPILYLLLVLPLNLSFHPIWFLIIGEVAVVWFEGFFMLKMMKGSLTRRASYLLSIIANITSLVLGFFLWALFIQLLL